MPAEIRVDGIVATSNRLVARNSPPPVFEPGFIITGFVNGRFTGQRKTSSPWIPAGKWVPGVRDNSSSG